jgi:hypothetical protein
VMNSRLSFDLLPDIRALPDPPSVVVQLHVEESDRSGYVRYVTTRYGNLVDAFSITSRHLARAVVRDYDIPSGKCHVIYTGVDAAGEFSPTRVTPVSGLEGEPLHLLYPGRLVKQKDPLLMVKVAAALKESGLDFRIHSIGDGEMMEEVRAAVSTEGLADVVVLHGAQREVAPWYAGCHLMLLTSEFEGVPYVVFEAMAMGLPTVAPALPGVAEALGSDSSELITPRDDVQRFVEAITALAAGEETRRKLGTEARLRALRKFSLREMADAHDDLYREVLAKRADSRYVQPAAVARTSAPFRFHARSSRGAPLVSVIVPCFNHGRYLAHCLESIKRQSYPAIETIIVDDGSTDEETVEELQRLAQDPDLTVMRMPTNRGPSGARNAGIARASGRYILPVDADNLLLPNAVQSLVTQLGTAGERVGFIYPNLQYFGNRQDYFEAPAYNLYALLRRNYCDTSSLIDREIFDAGFSYAEDILLGHEDWDFVLQLASHGVYGEPAREKTLLFRKVGFTRSDMVEYAKDSFHVTVRDRHTHLYSREAGIKAHWSPALSMIGLDLASQGESAAALVVGLDAQTCSDVEVLVRSDDQPPPTSSGARVRRIPVSLARSGADALADGIDAARGRYILAAQGTGSVLLQDRAFVEKVLRTFESKADLAAIAFTDASSAGTFPYRLLRGEEGVELDAHAIVWSLRAVADMSVTPIPANDPVTAVAHKLSHADAVMQWRHAPGPASRAESEAHVQSRKVALDGSLPRSASEAAEREARLSAPALLSRVPERSLRRLAAGPWIPPETKLLARYREAGGEKRYVAEAEEEPRTGYSLEYYLGLINRFPLPGTAPLEAGDEGEGQSHRSPQGHGGAQADVSERTLGYVETVAFPLLDPIVVGVYPPAGRTLVCGAEDPLAGRVDSPTTIGWLESYPINPRRVPHALLLYDLEILTRLLDRGRRRHVYGVGPLQPTGEFVGELGYLHKTPEEGSVPVWVSSDGVFYTDSYTPVVGRPSVRAAAKWMLAPLRWRGLAGLAPRLQASMRRAATSLARLLKPPSESLARGDQPVAYLRPEQGKSGIPLYAAIHPVTGDQLLTCWRLEADDMGYVDVVLLGYLSAGDLPMGRPRVRRLSVPWASRFGMTARID